MSAQLDSGIAFNEVTIRAGHHDREWFYSPSFTRPRNPGDRQFPRAYRQRPPPWIRQKPRTLVEMTLDVVVNNLHTANEETLASLPLPYLWRIFNECATNRMLSLHVWKMFSKLLLADKDHNLDPNTTSQLYSYRAAICRPSLELSYYTRPLVCTGAIDFLACLTIVGAENFRADELLALARLGNLSHLTLDYGDRCLRSGGVTDNLLKGWSETKNAFPLLQNLKLISYVLTFRSFKYISTFPSLSLYGIRNSRSSFSWANIDRGSLSLAKEQGWTPVGPLGSRLMRTYLSQEPAVATPETPTVDLHIRETGPLHDLPFPVVVFRRVSTNSSTQSSEMPETPLPDRVEPDRTNLQPRKKRKVQDVLSSFES